jgi:hypothetical protein
VGFEPTISVFELAKTVHDSDCVVTVVDQLRGAEINGVRLIEEMRNTFKLWSVNLKRRDQFGDTGLYQNIILERDCKV